MHELSIAESIVRIAQQSAAGRRVATVEIALGHLRQVVPASLTFAFSLLAEGTALDGAELVIEEVPAVGRCRDCGAQSTMTQFPLQCDGCGGLDMEVLRGEELTVCALELELEPEDSLTTSGGSSDGC